MHDTRRMLRTSWSILGDTRVWPCRVRDPENQSEMLGFEGEQTANLRLDGWSKVEDARGMLNMICHFKNGSRNFFLVKQSMEVT